MHQEHLCTDKLDQGSDTSSMAVSTTSFTGSTENVPRYDVLTLCLKNARESRVVCCVLHFCFREKNTRGVKGGKDKK
jgi:hypothetical protein